MKFFLYILFISCFISCSKNNDIDKNDKIDITDSISQPPTIAQVIDSIVGTYSTTKIRYWNMNIPNPGGDYQYDTSYNVPLIITKLNDSMFELEGRNFFLIGSLQNRNYQFLNTSPTRTSMYNVSFGQDFHSIEYSHRFEHYYEEGFNQFGYK